MKPKLYNIVSRCIADGLNQGTIDHNHRREVRETPSPELVENMHMAIMRELTEYIEFGEENE